MISNESVELVFDKHSAYFTASQAKSIGLRIELLTGKPTKVEPGTFKGRSVHWLMVANKSIRKKINEELQL